MASMVMTRPQSLLITLFSPPMAHCTVVADSPEGVLQFVAAGAPPNVNRSRQIRLGESRSQGAR